MNFWFADHTDFRSLKETRVPDVFIFGGIIISKNSLVELIEIFRDVKSKYTHHNMPVKYNLKDLRDKYIEFELEEDFRLLLEDSYKWRKEIFNRSKSIDYTIIISCIESFKKGKDVSKNKDDLLRYGFSMALMRVGLEIGALKSDCCVILDWPEGNNPKPFDREYYYAFNTGKSLDGIKYLSGPLMNLGFADSVRYANMNHSIGLQFSDLIIGAFRDGFKSFCDGHDENLGIDITKLILPKFRSDYRSSIIQRGVVISNSNKELKKSVSKFINSLKD